MWVIASSLHNDFAKGLFPSRHVQHLVRVGWRIAALIGRAARERARGMEWEELYPRYIDGYAALNLHTRTMAEDGFRRKVNNYLQRQRQMQELKRATETPNPSA
jgi:hypothetical protein